LICALSAIPAFGEPAAPIGVRLSPNNKMTQTNSVIIAAIKPSMEYAKQRMSMCLGNARYSA
jgi:hypothetical protein